MSKFFITVLLALTLSACTTDKVPQSVTTNNVAPATTVETIPAGRFYFSADNCAACVTVASYIAQHNIKQRTYYIDRKIDNTGANVDLLKHIGKKCGIAEADLSVPLFWDGQKCYEGSDQVIQYFSQLPA